MTLKSIWQIKGDLWPLPGEKIDHKTLRTIAEFELYNLIRKEIPLSRAASRFVNLVASCDFIPSVLHMRTAVDEGTRDKDILDSKFGKLHFDAMTS